MNPLAKPRKVLYAQHLERSPDSYRDTMVMICYDECLFPELRPHLIKS